MSGKALHPRIARNFEETAPPVARRIKTEEMEPAREAPTPISASRAAEHFVRGVKSSLRALVDTFRKRPIASSAVVAANAALIVFLPAVAKLVGAAALGFAGYKIAKGLVLAVRHWLNNEPEKAEKAFCYVGHGVTDVVLKKAGGPFAKWIGIFQLPGKLRGAARELQSASESPQGIRVAELLRGASVFESPTNHRSASSPAQYEARG